MATKVGPIPPCAKCGTSEGRPRQGGTRPARNDGRPYGFDGGICLHCYRVLYNQSWRDRNREKHGTSRAYLVRPCDSCGEPEGKARHVSISHGKPARYSVVTAAGERWKVCHACRFPPKDDALRLAILEGPQAAPDVKEIARLARDTLRSQLGTMAAFVEPRYQGPADPAEAEAEKVRQAARAARREAREAERARKAWKITLPEARA